MRFSPKRHLTKEQIEFKNKNIKIPLDFIGVGFPRSGTTWLADNLRSHPEIYIPTVKEVGLFILTEDGIGPYADLEKLYRNFFPKNSAKCQGEFTTQYVLYDSHLKIKQHVDKPKILICLRNPVDMIYSFYWWRKATFEHHNIPSEFEKAYELDNIYERLGYIYQNIKPYFDLFPREDIKVIFFEQIKNDPVGLLADVYEFLGVNPAFVPDSANKEINVARKARSPYITRIIKFFADFARKTGLNIYARDLVTRPVVAEIYHFITKTNKKYPPINEVTRRELYNKFKSEIEDVERLLNVDLKNWKLD